MKHQTLLRNFLIFIIASSVIVGVGWASFCVYSSAWLPYRVQHTAVGANPPVHIDLLGKGILGWLDNDRLIVAAVPAGSANKEPKLAIVDEDNPVIWLPYGAAQRYCLNAEEKYILWGEKTKNYKFNILNAKINDFPYTTLDDAIFQKELNKCAQSKILLGRNEDGKKVIGRVLGDFKLFKTYGSPEAGVNSGVRTITISSHGKTLVFQDQDDRLGEGRDNGLRFEYDKLAGRILGYRLPRGYERASWKSAGCFFIQRFYLSGKQDLYCLPTPPWLSQDEHQRIDFILKPMGTKIYVFVRDYNEHDSLLSHPVNSGIYVMESGGYEKLQNVLINLPAIKSAPDYESVVFIRDAYGEEGSLANLTIYNIRRELKDR